MDEKGELYYKDVRESLVKITEQLNYIASTVESLRKDIKANDEKIRAFEIQMIKLADTTAQQQKEIESTVTRLDKTKTWIAGIASAVIISILVALLKLIIPSI